MVHPYLRRRSGEEKVDYPSEALRAVLGKTLGVPLFQEQAMKIAIVAAGFTPSEADGLRRAMATFRHVGTIHTFEQKLIEGMVARGYDHDFAARCFRQIEGFGTYGFPESHAASFALLVYLSAWLKCHHPAVFAAALLNSQPMGFYAPAQIIRDAREHGVELRAVDVNESDRDCTLEPGAEGPDGLALRLGLRQVKGLAAAAAEALMAARGNGYADPAALHRRAGLSAKALEALARADAFRSMGLTRREALWAVKGLPPSAKSSAKSGAKTGARSVASLPLFAAAGEDERGPDPAVALPGMSPGEEVVEDYASLRFSLKAHPISFLRAELAAEGMVENARLLELANGGTVKVAGLVLVQRPGTAKGVIFATLEDETGVANIIVWPDVFARYRKTVLAARLLGVEGPLQREGLVTHVIARRLFDLTPRLAALRAPPARELGGPLAAPPRDAGSPGRAARARDPIYRSRNFR
jgi:error-prone DNA polymerase